MAAVRESRENGVHPADPAALDLDTHQTPTSVATLFAALWWPVRSEGLEGIEGPVPPGESEELAGDHFRAGSLIDREQPFPRCHEVAVAAQIALVDGTKTRFEINFKDHIIELDLFSGSLQDLIGQEVLEIYETTEEGSDSAYDFYTWNFYRIVTFNTTVVIKWLGESNGYYSETVDFLKI